MNLLSILTNKVPTGSVLEETKPKASQRQLTLISLPLKATFRLTISMRGQRATGKFKGIITITGVAGLL